MEKAERRHEQAHNKRFKSKQNRTSNILNSHSGLAEKKRIAPKEEILKIKNNKARLGNVKGFHGRRHDSGESNVKSIWLETGKEGSKKAISIFNEKPVTLLTKNKPKPLSESACNTPTSLPINKTPPKNIKDDAKPLKYNLEDHMGQWAQKFCEPLILPSTNVEFEIPYCYSEEFYSKLSANCCMMQPFSSVGEPCPVLAWNSYVDVWYEKAQLALQFYRQLCVQPSRVPMQMITIKRSVAQFVAEQCALLGTDCTELYFETFAADSMLESIGMEGKKKQTVYVVSDDSMPTKIDAVDGQVKHDNSIYTESWQN